MLYCNVHIILLMNQLMLTISKERDIMATKSILKNIDIRDKERGKALVIALERAAQIHTKDVQLSRTYEEISGDKLRSIILK